MYYLSEYRYVGVSPTTTLRLIQLRGTVYFDQLRCYVPLAHMNLSCAVRFQEGVGVF